MKLPVLPTYYYHDHFTELLGFVSEAYGAVLTSEHQAFIAKFLGLSKDAQCLLIRMVNRRNRIFRHATFRYAEINDPAGAVSELSQCGHVRGILEEDYEAFLGCLSKDALLKGGKSAGFAEIKSSWRQNSLNTSSRMFHSEPPTRIAAAGSSLLSGALSRLSFCFISISERRRTI